MRHLKVLLPNTINVSNEELINKFNTIVGINNSRLQQVTESHWCMLMDIHPMATRQDLFNAGISVNNVVNSVVARVVEG